MAMADLVDIFSIAASDMHTSEMQSGPGFFWAMAALTSLSLFAIGANVVGNKRNFELLRR